MGVINLSLSGSFGERRMKTFSAMDKGHASAVAEAIQYLAEVEMPKAIENDHRCHKEGLEPEKGFAGAGKMLNEQNT